MAKQHKRTKQVSILAHYTLKRDGKPNGAVCYLVRSSDGTTQYCITLLNGKATGCSCPAVKPCYHMTQLEQIEAQRQARTKQREQVEQALEEGKRFYEELRATVPAGKRVGESLVSLDVDLDEVPARRVLGRNLAQVVQEQAGSGTALVKMLQAPLSSNHPFSLMR